MQHRSGYGRRGRAFGTLVRGVLASLALAVLAGCPAPRPPASPADEAPVSPVPRKPAAHRGLGIETIQFEGKRFTVCTVELSRHHIELYWRDEQKEPFGSFAALNQWLSKRGRRLLFAMNAGMYMEDLSPVGLYVEGGKELRPLNLRDGKSNFCLKPNGVFAVTEDGAAVVQSSQYGKIRGETKLATQSGPMLVIDGELHPKFSATSQSRLFRNGVGVVSPQKVVFAITETPVNFHEFAVLFRDRLHCRNALYLDGTISSLYSEQLGRCDGMVDIGPILAVTAAADGTSPLAR